MLDNENKKFSFSTIENFDTHINKSIYGYDNMNNIIIQLSQYFIEDNTKVIDIGCSTGKLIKNIKEYTNKKANYIGLEIEDNFTKDFKSVDNLILQKQDIIDYNNFNNSSLITSIFTLQFIPLKDRLNLLKKIYDGLNYGGAFILSEKVISDNSKINDILTFLYYDYKKVNFSNDEILNKESDLRDIMKPITLEDNISLLQKAGFKKIELFWRTYNFCSIIAIK